MNCGSFYISLNIYSILSSSNLCNTVCKIFLNSSSSLLYVLWNPLFKRKNELLQMPPEVASRSKLCTNRLYLSNNQKFTCGINSLDNLFLHSLGTHLYCWRPSFWEECSHFFLFNQYWETRILRLMAVCW